MSADMTDWWAFLLGGLIIAGLGGWYYQWRRQLPAKIPEERVAWRLVIPREARFGVAEAAAWFTAVSPLLPPGSVPPSVELRGERGELVFEVSAPANGEAILQSQLQAWFPGARLERTASTPPTGGVAVQALQLAKPDLYPIRVPQAKEPDPLLGVVAALAQGDQPAGLRITWGPAPADWPQWAPAALAAAKQGRRLPPRGLWFWLYRVMVIVREATAPAAPRARSVAVPAAEWARATAKVQGSVVQARLSVWATGRPRAEAEQRVRSLAAALQTASRDPTGNALVAAGPPHWRESGPGTDRLPGPAVVLSAGELAGLFHVSAPGNPLVPSAPSRQVAPVPRLLLSQ